jgi:hypothetical protein
MSDSFPVACTLSPAGLEKRKHLLGFLKGAEVHRLPDGLSLHFAHGAVRLQDLGEVIDLEMECCRFLSFGLHVDAAGIRLDLTGPEGTADFLRHELGLGS